MNIHQSLNDKFHQHSLPIRVFDIEVLWKTDFQSKFAIKLNQCRNIPIINCAIA